MPSLFITSTDNHVGKTVVIRALLQTLAQHNIPIVPYKPIACGNEEALPTEDNQMDYANEEDQGVLTLLNSTSQAVAYREINSYTFIHSSTPVFSALNQINHIQIQKLDNDLMRLTRKYHNILVEGTNGWLTPINQDFSFADWVKQQQIPVLLVVGIKEGCGNHALLTAQAMQNRGIPLLGWIVNRINPGLRHYMELVELLTRQINAPLLGEIPYLGHPEIKELHQYIQNPTPLIDYFTK